MKNDKVFTGPLGFRVSRRAKSISQDKLDKLISRKINNHRITFEIGNEPDEVLFYKYNPERSGEEKFLGKRIVA